VFAERGRGRQEGDCYVVSIAAEQDEAAVYFPRSSEWGEVGGLRHLLTSYEEAIAVCNKCWLVEAGTDALFTT
jgi:hypothetical protein